MMVQMVQSAFMMFLEFRDSKTVVLDLELSQSLIKPFCFSFFKISHAEAETAHSRQCQVLAESGPGN